MLKRILTTGVFFLLMPFVFLRSRELSLAYYVFSSFMVFPLYLLYALRERFLFFAALAVFVIVEFYFLTRLFSPELFLLIAAHGVLLWILIRYYRSWSAHLSQETRRNEEILREWEILKHKHQHRLDNLQHLEKQAASLMDLFEIARNFSECLSYPALADLLYKNVRPELPFSKMRLLLLNEPQGENPGLHCFTIQQTGVEEGEAALSDREYRMIMAAEKERKFQSDESVWLFPLFIESERLAYLSVDGAAQGDLAKFEVLVAHLVLQIKKIKLYETVKGLSIIDDLTQVFVRRHFLELFESELNRSIKHGFSLALLMLDIDHFKRYNDDFGHLVGDATLREVAVILRSNLRKVDIVGRYGGEEFIVVIPETDAAGALEVAERIRSSIARHTFRVYDVTTKVTASAGVSVYPDDFTQEELNLQKSDIQRELIKKADKSLYRAKEEGRNRVVRYRDL